MTVLDFVRLTRANLKTIFVMFSLGLLIAFLYVPMVRFVYKRLVKNYRPPERKIKDDLF